MSTRGFRGKGFRLDDFAEGERRKHAGIISRLFLQCKRLYSNISPHFLHNLSLNRLTPREDLVTGIRVSGRAFRKPYAYLHEFTAIIVIPVETGIQRYSDATGYG